MDRLGLCGRSHGSGSAAVRRRRVALSSTVRHRRAIRWAWGAVLLTLLVAIVATTAFSPWAQPASGLERIEQRAIALRELAPVRPIPRTFVARADVRGLIEARVQEDVTPEEIEANQIRWEVLGFIPTGLDLIRLYLDVYGEQVLGFYDWDHGMLFVVADPSNLGPGDELTLAHEVTHALQDQHYDLRAGQDARRGENDQQLAYQALVEGDATLVTLLYAQRHLSPSQLREAAAGSRGASSALEAAPLIVRRELQFPYNDGLAFLMTHYQRGSWGAVDQVWRNPPVSTEQILHPEKYVAGESPVVLALPDLGAVLGPDWRLLEETTLGELDWRIFFEQHLDRATAERVSSGWGGDRFQLFRRDADGAVLLAMRTAWDSDEDATEFLDAYPRATAARHRRALDGPRPPDAGGVRTWDGQGGEWHHYLSARGAYVDLIVTSAPEVATRVATALRPALVAP